jgi:dienelactone hydrolase
MGTVLLDNRELKHLQPAELLWRFYQPGKAKYRFNALTLRAARAWQRKTRNALGKAIGFNELPTAPLAPKLIETVDRGDYVREKIVIRTSRYSLMPVYLLLPKNAPSPYPVVIAFHGHGYGVKDIVGLWEDGEERLNPDGYHKDFAVALCRRGFAVAAPEISCFGERQTDFSYLKSFTKKGSPSTCQHTAALAFHLGGSPIGMRVHDGRKLIDFLERRKDLDTAKLGAMGISGGGMNNFYATCMDKRIRATVVSGYFCTFRDSILAMGHCNCNYVPGLSEFGEMYDLAGLIAPRPMLVESANRDPIFPRIAVKKSVAEARKIYRLFDAEQSLQTDYFEGRHQISGRLAYDFLWDKLATC